MIEIERILLSGIDVTPERAYRLRGLVAAELRRLLEQEGLEMRGRSAMVRSITATPLPSAEAADDRHLATGLARRIVQSLRETG
jgi:hypothetical protein